MTTTQQVLKSDQRKKQRLVNSLGGKCCICGYNRCLSALQFHHKNPEEKDFTISQNAHIGFEKALQEVKKCILVCANCHREIHAGLIEGIQKIECYKEELAQEELRKLNEVKTKKIYFCKDCGKEISAKAIRCEECARKFARKVERPSREELKELIRNKPFTQIAKQYDVTDNAIRKWCDAEKLPRTKKEINSYSDEEWKNV